MTQPRKKLDAHYPFIHGVKEAQAPVNIKLALRGNPENLGPEVPRHFLSVFSDGDPAPITAGSGRLELADLIVKQPIAMRVMVNRIWKEHFGSGIVDTPSNFGFGGERPTNPELLEYLASDFAKNGMSIKKLQREILLSSVYQLSTDNDKVAFEKDSGDRFYWRANKTRMSAEEIRDSILQVAGDLDDAEGGPSDELTPQFKRRTVYGKVSRYKLDAYLQLFDFPTPNASAEKRFITTVPLQRLFLMNSDFVQVESESLAKRVAAESDNKARIRKLYTLVYGRPANEAEIDAGLTWLRTEPMKEYEESKKAPKKDRKSDAAAEGDKADKNDKADKADKGDKTDKGSGEGAEPASAITANPSDQDPVAAAGSGAEVIPVAAEVNAAPDAAMGMGMMGGMGGMMGNGGGRGGRAQAVPEVKYTATVWGRYAKILLSSSEFLFIN